MNDETDDAPETGGEWDIDAAYALARLIEAGVHAPGDSRLRLAANRAAEALAQAIVDYHSPEPEVRH